MNRAAKLMPANSNAPRLAPRISTGPKVTAVMPTFRRAHVIGDTIRCLLHGEWTDFELVVQDDGDGSDGTGEAVAAAARNDPRVLYNRNPQKLGIPGNLNAAIMTSRGEFIAMCHDHDVYKPSFLRRMVETLERHPSALFVHCAIDTITESGKYVQSFINDFSELTPGCDWLKVMLSTLACQVCALTLVRRSAHEKFGLYNPQFDFVSDVELWMRLSTQGDVAYVREPLIQVREREQDHYATNNGVKLVRRTAAIHRLYLPFAYHRQELTRHRIRLQLATARSVAQWRASRVRRQLRRILQWNQQS
jgi:glycosyltransferase involved in cell wall biosynthesis